MLNFAREILTLMIPVDANGQNGYLRIKGGLSLQTIRQAIEMAITDATKDINHPDESVRNTKACVIVLLETIKRTSDNAADLRMVRRAMDCSSWRFDSTYIQQAVTDLTSSRNSWLEFVEKL